MSVLFRQRAAATSRTVAERLHDELVAAVRRPVFYLRFGVPDTFEGRFDLLVLHVAVALRRLAQQGGSAAPVAQHLVDTLFQRFDVALREMGVSDIGVPKRMKALAQAFNGRMVAYHAALTSRDEPALADAVQRNICNGREEGRGLASYAFRAMDSLADCDLTASHPILPAFPDPIETS